MRILKSLGPTNQKNNICPIFLQQKLLELQIKIIDYKKQTPKQRLCPLEVMLTEILHRVTRLEEQARQELYEVTEQSAGPPGI